MDEHILKNIVEAALLAAARPLTVDELRELFEERERPEAQEVRRALSALEEDYAERGIEVREISSGFRIQVRGAVSEYISRLWQERPGRYSRAMLETLALIAYRQPITRAEIEEIRGVGINQNILRTFFDRGWIRVVGHRQVPGQPELLGTTREFLDYFNLKSLEQLPTLAELRDMDNVGVQLELPGAEQPAATPGAQADTADAASEATGAGEAPEDPKAPEASETDQATGAGAGEEDLTDEPDMAPAASDEDEDAEDEAPETLQTRGLVARSADEVH